MIRDAALTGIKSSMLWFFPDESDKSDHKNDISASVAGLPPCAPTIVRSLGLQLHQYLALVY